MTDIKSLYIEYEYTCEFSMSAIYVYTSVLGYTINVLKKAMHFWVITPSRTSNMHQEAKITFRECNFLKGYLWHIWLYRKESLVMIYKCLIMQQTHCKYPIGNCICSMYA